MNNLIELIGLIEKRPAFYLGRNTISTLRAFLDGWVMREPSTVIDSNVLNDFQQYIEEYYSIRGHSWDKIILLFSQDEADALDTFFIRFNEIKK